MSISRYLLSLADWLSTRQMHNQRKPACKQEGRGTAVSSRSPPCGSLRRSVLYLIRSFAAAALQIVFERVACDQVRFQTQVARIVAALQVEHLHGVLRVRGERVPVEPASRGDVGGVEPGFDRARLVDALLRAGVVSDLLADRPVSEVDRHAQTVQRAGNGGDEHAVGHEPQVVVAAEIEFQVAAMPVRIVHTGDDGAGEFHTEVMGVTPLSPRDA